MIAPIVAAKIVIEAASVDFINGVVDENTAPMIKKKTSGVK